MSTFILKISVFVATCVIIVAFTSKKYPATLIKFWNITFFNFFFVISTRFTYLIDVNLFIDAAVSSTNSAVAFTSTNIQPDILYLVTVQAKDSSNQNIHTGGEEFYLDIRNLWKWESISECIESVSSEDVISEASRTLMFDNEDGTYTGQYLLNKEGQFTASVFHYDRDHPVKLIYYPGWQDMTCK